MSTAELLTIGQVWERKRGRQRWRVRQVWRADGLVALVSDDLLGQRETIAFSHLRRYYRKVDA